MMKHTRPKVCSGKDRLSYAEPEKRGCEEMHE